MLAHVGQCLLYDPVRGQIDRGGQLPLLADHLLGDRQARGGEGGDELGEPVKAGGRFGGRLVGGVRLAQQPDGGAQLFECGPPGLPDVRQRLPGLDRLGLHGDPRHARLHVDQCDVVAEYVVQLAGDPQSFLDDPAGGLLLAGLLGPVGALLDRRDVRAPVPRGLPDRGGKADLRDKAQDLGAEPGTVAEEHPRVGEDHRRHHSDDHGVPPRADQGQRIDGDHGRQHQRAAKAAEGEVTGHPDRGDQQDEARPLPPEDERSGDHRVEHHGGRGHRPELGPVREMRADEGHHVDGESDQPVHQIRMALGGVPDVRQPAHRFTVAETVESWRFPHLVAKRCGKRPVMACSNACGSMTVDWPTWTPLRKTVGVPWTPREPVA